MTEKTPCFVGIDVSKQTLQVCVLTDSVQRCFDNSPSGHLELRQYLAVEAAVAARNTKGTCFKDKHHRLQARQGKKRANVSIAHKLLVSAYHILKTGQRYKELGEHYLDLLDQARVKNNLVRRLERLGFAVEIQRRAA